MNTIEQWHKDPMALIGKRLDVLLCEDNTQHKGMLIGIVGLTVNDEVISENMPQIKLEDGRIVHGVECWWTLESESE